MNPFQQWARGWVRDVRRAFPSRIDRFKFTDRERIRETLLADPEIAAAVAAHVAVTGVGAETAWRSVHQYVEEIVPAFNLLAYYRFGYAVARMLIPLFYKVSVGQEARDALNALPPDGSVLYLMNHRSNADYVVVAYVLSGQVAISYAVGEWARIWPLEAVFKSFGSYFVRRRFREPLYHKVLERYVQLITRNGVTQGIFLEGGLTRDGAFREPKLGLLDYLLGVKRETGFARPLHVIPVAINYDRVLEDRSLLREIESEEARLTLREQVSEVSSYLVKVSVRFLLRRAHRYGRACVNFGPPISVDDWLAANPGVLELPREQRLPRIKGLADLVMNRIGAVMPVTAVALACTALLQHPGDSISRAGFVSLLTDLRFVLRGAGAPLVQEDLETGEILDRALVMLTLRRLVVETPDGFQIDRSQELLLRYYANSIAHFLPRMKTSEESFRAKDGVVLRYTLRQAGHPCVVLVAPGIFVHRSNPEHVMLAERLTEVADVATLDVRGHGDSGGAFTWGLREPEDVAGLAAHLGRDYDRVGGLGFSFGGYHVAVAAALHGAFAAVTMVAAPRSLFILDHNFLIGGLRRSLPLMLQRQRRLTRVSLSPGGRRAVPDRLVERIAPRPLLIVHGTADWLIPVKHAQTLYDRAREPKRLLLVPDGLHAEYLLQQDAERVVRPICEFFAESL